ncbi:flagellar biosynthesis regulator FlaF [Alloyangia pacifica]|uniref:flagellar biosynthesis regulator FlaF n=1 Tax=Alloyangia pacifica TaxID=311180 RepID=UPI00296FAD96|nr:flagellar biosynthesis regulator FlaF [Alloyangia pacifica]
MNAHLMARRAYALSNSSTRTERAIEYDLIARVTHRIKAAAEAGPTSYPLLVAALHDNRQLWTALAVDVADGDNKLPQDLRARIFYLSEFVQQHTGKVLARKARLAPLIEVNRAVLAGLNPQPSRPQTKAVHPPQRQTAHQSNGAQVQ